MNASPVVPASRPIIGTSWKMNFTRDEARAYLRALRRLLDGRTQDRLVFVLPPFTSLSVAEAELAGSGIAYGAQDVHPEPFGAHTGDIGAPMLADLGCRIVETGHSERRRDHCETDELVGRKVEATLASGMWSLVCVGESGAEFEDGRAEEAVDRQLAAALPAEAAAWAERVLVAYEPWWAIGIGATAAPPGHVARMHAFIHDWLDRRLAGGADGGAAGGIHHDVPVLYGGSVDLRNAGALLATPGVDGLFVGRAALDVDVFATIALVRGE